MADIPVPPDIANLPTPVPARGNSSQASFTSNANAFMGALPTLVSDINAAMQWIKDAADSAETLGQTETGEIQQAITDLNTAKDNALLTLQGVLDQIEDIAVPVQNIEGQINDLKTTMLAEIEQAKIDALAELDTKCGGG